MDGGDWDLHAVVRGCAAAHKNTTAPTNKEPFTSMPLFHQSSSDNFTGLMGDKNTNPFQGLQDAYQELCGDYPPPPAAEGGGRMSTAAFQPHQGTTVHDQVVNNPAYHQMNMQQDNIIHDEFKNQGYGGGFVSNAAVRPRRRKNQQLKMVRQMTQEELSADSWAWRKYGQKPIKGSPYPRNYYRCSTSKGCTARKQVERSPEDPVIFIVSYTGEHTHPKPSHRSSLAGSTRTKPNMLLHQKGAVTSTSSSSPAASSSSFSPCQPMVEGEAVKENEDLVENLDNSEELDQDEDDNGFGMIPANDDDDDLYDHHDLFSGGDW